MTRRRYSDAEIDEYVEQCQLKRFEASRDEVIIPDEWTALMGGGRRAVVPATADRVLPLLDRAEAVVALMLGAQAPAVEQVAS